MVTSEWLKKIELFVDLDESQINDVLSHSSVESLSEGKVIFQEGEKAGHLYVLVRGAIDLTVKTQEKIGILTSQIQKEGTVFGLPCLIEPYHYNVTAKCLIPSQVLKIDADHLKKSMEHDPRVGMAIMKRLASIYFNRLNDLRNGVVKFFELFRVKIP